MLNYRMAAENRRELVTRIGELTGDSPKYMGVPSCAYRIGQYTVGKDGMLTVREEDADAGQIRTLIGEGLIEGDTDSPLEISLPLEKHSGISLRNLVNLIYSRASLINKALNTHFHVSKELVESLRDDSCTFTVQSFQKALEDYEAAHGDSGMEGLRLEESRITFCGFPPATDPEYVTACGLLVTLMNKQAISQKRIQAKTVDETNEKYSFRIWLIRLGMKGDEYKATRKILMKNLSGNTAFRTPEDAEKFSAKMKAKRDAERAAERAAG